MPFYEYECSSCKFYVEALQKVSDAPLKKCPSCKKPTLKKLVSAPVFRLKGGGWYETDFKSEQEQKRNLVGDEKEPAAEPKADTSSDKPADKKPEAKAEKSAGKVAGGKKGSKPSARAKAKPKTKAPAKKK